MRGMPVTGVMAVCAAGFIFLMSFASNQVFADQTIKLSPGAKVEIQGNTAIINNGGGNGIAGTYNCFCSAGGAGECQMVQYSGAVICQASASGGCTKSCVLSTSTGRVSPAAPAAKSK
jgi:hypothetical protein